MPINQHQIRDLYRSGAKYYDLAVILYKLIGLRISSYRSRAFKMLYLRKGDTVIDLGCGTGLNFPYLIDQIGHEGRLIGIDITLEMLNCAQKRIAQNGWKNVELIESDIATYQFPKEVDAILSTGVFGYVTEFDHVIQEAARALSPDGRLVIMDVKLPNRWPIWLFKSFVWLGKPFGVSMDYFVNRPWESVESHFKETSFQQIYGSAIYISSGKAR
jgi:ubiquinone/menaquinone biosynthesis C-methylase UbiE